MSHRTAARMKFEINRQSEQPVHLQLREQIIFRVSTGELSIGHLMPSVRELARQLKIHHNTVSLVYAELARERWLVKQPGSRYVVVQRGPEKTDPGDSEDLDDLIDRTIRLAGQRGYSLQQLSRHGSASGCWSESPDHLLIVEPEPGMGVLMREEIRQGTGHAPAACSISMLRQNPSLATGAALLTPAYLVDCLEGIPGKDRQVVPITYSPVEAHLARVRDLDTPSAVGMVSVSAAGLKTLTGLLAPVVGERHTLHEFIMEWPIGKNGPGFKHYTVTGRPAGPGVREWEAKAQSSGQETPPATRAGSPDKGSGEVPFMSAADLGFIDLLLCDSIVYGVVKHPQSVKYQLLSDESLQEIASVAASLVPKAKRTGTVRKTKS